MIALQNLTKTFKTADGPVYALKHVNLTIHDGDIYGIIGMSGAGKSTLVRCINMLEVPTEGSVIFNDRNLGTLNAKELRAVRRRITMIFQGFNLCMQRTCLKNVALPLLLAGVSRDKAYKEAAKMLEIVGLPHKANAYPAQLSGGQQQRVAIARALVTQPEVLLCDEATSALDPKTTHAILELIREINKKLGITCIIITHQMSVVQEVCNRVAILEDGAVVEEGVVADVFANPQADATRNLIYPDMADSVSLSDSHGQRVRLIFNGADAAKEPLLANLAIYKGIPATILSASTRSVGDKVYGYMLLEIPGGPQDLAEAVEFLRNTPNVSVQVEVSYAQKGDAPAAKEDAE